MSGISTHVLDTSSGHPLAGLRVTLYREGEQIGSAMTDRDGRCRSLLASGAALSRGTYRLVFDTSVCFIEKFYPEVSVVFTVIDPAMHYHVPLLISPFGYTTYRGS